jgi:hybrid cluster-associated redox disulfide protein
MRKSAIIKFTKDSKIGDVIQKYPQSIDVFMNYGLHCIGCSLAGWETIEQGAQVHGFNNKIINQLLKELNQYISNQLPDLDNDTSPIKVTSRAAKQVLNLMKKSKGAKYLRITLVQLPFGHKYGFKFEKKKSKSDIIIEKYNTHFVISNKDFKVIKGSTLDYLSFIPGNGFKIYPAMK